MPRANGQRTPIEAVYRVNTVCLGPQQNGSLGHFDILCTDCLPIHGDIPRICPRAQPKLPLELLCERDTDTGEVLMEQPFRELGLILPGETILWVGRQATAETLCMWGRGCDCFCDVGKGNADKPRTRKRRRASQQAIPQITEKQTEALYLFGEHKGNIAAAAKAAGISRQAMEKRYQQALRKMAKAGLPKPKTQSLPRDRRGQETI